MLKWPEHVLRIEGIPVIIRFKTLIQIKGVLDLSPSVLKVFQL